MRRNRTSADATAANMIEKAYGFVLRERAAGLELLVFDGGVGLSPR